MPMEMWEWESTLKETGTPARLLAKIVLNFLAQRTDCFQGKERNSYIFEVANKTTNYIKPLTLLYFRDK